MDLASSPARTVSRESVNRPHLWSAAAAGIAVAVGLLTINQFTARRIARDTSMLAALNLPEMSQGVVLQRRLARLPHSLMVYGSSELSFSEPTRADLFFRHYPAAGFQAILIGQAGDRCLLMLEEIAALGQRARGKKFVIFLSPNWFLAPAGLGAHSHSHRQFATKISPLQTTLLLLDSHLEGLLKEQIAFRLINSEDVINGTSPLLGNALAALRERSLLGSGIFHLEEPLLWLQAALFVWHDRWQTAQLAESCHAPSVPADKPQGGLPDWSDLVCGLNDELTQHGLATPYTLDLPGATPPAFLTEADPLHIYPRGDHAFLNRMNAATEWVDFELLLRTIEQTGAQVLLVEQPFNGSVLDACHVSAPMRRRYYDRLRDLAARHGVAQRDFSQFEGDRSFFSDLMHPSAKAWLYYDQALDAFYHLHTSRVPSHK